MDEEHGSINRTIDEGMHSPGTLQPSPHHTLLVQLQASFLLPDKRSITFPTTRS